MSDLYPERVLTAACRAGGKVIYEQNLVQGGIDPNEALPFDDLPREIQNALVDAAIPIVWAGINAIPDGRWAIWQQGYIAADNGEDESVCPYPPPEIDISALD